MLPCSSYIGVTVSFTFSCDLVLRLSLITMLPCSSYIGLTVSFTFSCDLVLRSLISLCYLVHLTLVLPFLSLLVVI